VGKGEDGSWEGKGVFFVEGGGTRISTQQQKEKERLCGKGENAVLIHPDRRATPLKSLTNPRQEEKKEAHRSSILTGEGKITTPNMIGGGKKGMSGTNTTGTREMGTLVSPSTLGKEVEKKRKG